ncbi:uncharacterized protein I206_101086 [Kwoniella pini CBS 10737]|uniref:TauD/TfdA-like domain-containing protein n=1 Tax=Kwoniella pini CBS 10737 TaxID=1296096 RepID=A0A1B9IC39_9TREE|nr:uncharacterized protein I206_00241 [Kwoniella pini CBS 10737]OCF52940.1 hypothetical protein I206_00241 [Kwoniella pini CBS 10737]
MATRIPVALTYSPIRHGVTSSSYTRNFQRCYQSTSESNPSSSASRSSYSRANLATLAAEGDLVVPDKTSGSKSLQTPNKSHPIPNQVKPLAFPPPKLKANPYAPNYAISEEDLDEPIEFANDPLSSDVGAENYASSSNSSIKGQSHHAATTLEEPNRGSHIDWNRNDSQTDRRESFYQMEGKTIELGVLESVTLHKNYIIYKNRTNIDGGVITWGRLRDSCTCKLCRDPNTSQKTYTTGQAMRKAYDNHPPLIEGIDLNSGTKGLKITWGNNKGEKSHISFFSRSKLRYLCEANSIKEGHYPSQIFNRKLWDSTSISNNQSLKLPYDMIRSRKAYTMLRLLEQLHTYGLVIIEGVPTNPTNDEDCHLRKVMGWIGEIRNTFYGETWNVKSMPQSKNVAYTNVDLGLHMDLLYFSSPPRIQALHCLRNRVNGGISYFVDSFKVAMDLPEDLYKTLTSTYIPYIYDNDNHYLRYSHKVIEDFGKNGNLISNPHTAINWSPPFRDTWVPSSSDNDEMNLEIKAKNELNTLWSITEFENKLNDSKYKLEFKMKEGDLILFDNRRILHARTSFYDKSIEEIKNEKIQIIKGEPNRWLKGCYLDGEVLWDKLNVLKKQIEKEKLLKDLGK